MLTVQLLGELGECEEKEEGDLSIKNINSLNYTLFWQNGLGN